MKIWNQYFVIIVLALFSSSSTLKCQEALRHGNLDKLYNNLELSRFKQDLVNGNRIFRFYYRHQNAKYIRIQIAPLRLDPDDEITIFSEPSVEGTVRKTTIKGPMEMVSRAVGSLFVPGSSIEIMLKSEKISSNTVIIEEIHYQDDNLSPWKSIFGNNDIVNIIGYETSSVIARNKRAIAMLSFERGGQSRVCTGFVITENLLITNQHCVDTSDICNTTHVIFDYEKNYAGSINFGDSRRCAAVILVSEELDLAVLQLDKSVDVSISPLRISVRNGQVSRPAALIQHPGGDFKQVSELGCQVITEGVQGKSKEKLDTDFSHRCDTINGSSGSPIIVNISSGISLDTGPGCVIGLHHWGFTSDGFYNSLNRAVRSSLIAELLEKKNIDFSKCEQ